MSDLDALLHDHRFPATRPKVTVVPSAQTITEVDWPELLGWQIVPREGERAVWAAYDAPDWRLTGVTAMAVLGPAEIHGVAGVELALADLDLDAPSALKPGTMWARLTEETKGWLGLLWDRPETGVRKLQTFLDEGFDWAWGEHPRRVADEGWFQPDGRGGWRTALPEGVMPPYHTGCGTFDVTVWGRTVTCLRVFGVEGPFGPTEPVTEHYVASDGRQVYHRHRKVLTEGAEAADVLVIDGFAYGPWYDNVPAPPRTTA